MNITFFIGNGFDLNLGLKTSYNDFIKTYLNVTDSDSDEIKKFKQYIKDNEENWSDAELEFGQYTSRYSDGHASEFLHCWVDFVKNLSKYLSDQEKKIDLSEQNDNVGQVMKDIENLYEEFPVLQRNIIKKTYDKDINNPIYYNFICYNYTRTLDQLLDVAKGMSSTIGKHIYRNTTYGHKLNQIFHVHGTVDKNMVLAVNDESQIENIALFENDSFSKKFMIKKLLNDSYQENADNIAKDILSQSSIIYIYGMSLGQTDTAWWQRIIEWLRCSAARQLIIHCFDAPNRESSINYEYQLYELEKRKDFLSFCKLPENEIEGLQNRIHITKRNIFEGIYNLVQKEVK